MRDEWNFREPPGHELFLTKQFMSITKADNKLYCVWVWDWLWIATANEATAVMTMQKIIRPKRN